ncbi:biopolymer transporter ExbD [Flavobacterium sp. Sd200]|uniref:ExbD/TolR family protein n=1 Tax=Flavobacterium sp. Sd200 TaxID=2692211 RepID=UPI001372069A|nr:biopolymer transporter ExbD [Flavobacterium sp. Sd200]MXN92892.1 biopolymer transporter ExbD [Flavobacterium sp. Sd200]
MAELNTGGGGDGKKVRSKKSNPGVDLTAMVDLAFLLITFFMLTTTLSKPQSMPLAMPEKDPKDQPTDITPVEEDRMMTILIGKDSRILWYMGMLKTPRIQPTEAAFGKDGIRKEILKNTAYAKQFAKKEGDGLIVNIKASDAASYKNLVDILDEMAINKVQLYAIGDITPEEITLLKDKGLY